jgi:putative MATE family efflux protein
MKETVRTVGQFLLALHQKGMMNMRKLVTDKGFYKLLLSIGIPIAAQQLIHFGIAMTDSFMLGQISEVQITASGQANQPKFIFQLILFGLGGGGSVLAAQYWGSRDMEKVRAIVGIVARIALILSLIFTAVIKIFPRQVIEFYLKNETEEDAYIISEAIIYLKAVSWGYFFFGFSVALQNIIRSVEIVKITIISSLTAFVTNIVLNRIFIFGAFGIPAMGIKGAAIATLIAQIIDFIITVTYVFFIDKKLMFKFKYIFRRDKALMKDFTRYSFPVIANEFMWGLGISVQAAILGQLNPDAVAANNIVGVLHNLATIVIFGGAFAAAVVIGKKIGEGDREGAKNYGFTIMVLSVILGILGMVMMLSMRGFFISLYKIDDEVRDIAEKLLVIIAIVLIFVSVSSFSIVGVLRGAGDTKFTMTLEFITLWLIAIPLAAYVGFVLKAHILIVCALLKIDEPIKAVTAFIRTTKDKSFKDVTRSRGETPAALPLDSENKDFAVNE